MNDFGVGRVVADGDGGGAALAHAEQRAGHLAVVGEGADVVFGRGFEEVGGDLEGDVGRGGGEELVAAEQGAGRHGRELSEAAARDHSVGSLGCWEECCVRLC